MPFMEEVRKLFKRRKPVEIDLTDGSATDFDSVSNAEQGGDGKPLASVQRRKPTLAEIQQGYDEVMGLVRKIGEHLDAQTQRTEKLVELMERLPEAIDSLPELHRQNSRLLDVLNEHLAASRKRDETLGTTLGKLSESSDHQTEVLGLLQQQFDTSTRASEQMTKTLGSFSHALGNLSENNHRSTEILSGLVRSTEDRETQLIDILGRTQKWIVGILIAIGVVAVAAIVLAAIAMMQ